MIEDVTQWPSGTVRLVWRGPEFSGLPLTGAHGFCFLKDGILVCDIVGRGPTIPGGHIDTGESAVDCLVREAAEEGGVDLLSPVLLGYIEADHRGNDDYDGRYPLRSVQAIFRADVSEVRRFTGRAESRARRFIPAGDLPSHHHEWNAVLEHAFTLARQAGGGRL